MALAFGIPSFPSFTTKEMASATLSISSVLKPLEVTAGVPIRIPEVSSLDELLKEGEQ